MEVASRIAPYAGRTYYDWVGEERSDICYKRILEHIVECVVEDREPSATGEDGRAALETILAGYRSAREGREITIG